MKLAWVAALSFLFLSPLIAGNKKHKEKDEQPQKEKSPYKDFAEVTKNTTKLEGFWTVYQGKENLYLLLPESQLGKPFLLTSHIGRGIGTEMINGGLMMDREARLVSLTRFGDKVYLLQKPTRYVAGKDTAVAQALDLTFGESVLDATSILSITNAANPGKDDKSEDATQNQKALLIDIQSWLTNDLAGIEDALKDGLSEKPGVPGNAKLDKQRSYIENFKIFPNNIVVNSTLTFSPAKTAAFNSVPDPRFIPITLTYNFSALPETLMTLREADPRVGYFTFAVKDFSTYSDSDFFKCYVRRWRLEPGEKVGELYKPKKQILYYIDRTVPEEWRDAVKQGIESWNRAFEAAGFKDAIRAEILPEGADADDLRYATVRWSTSDSPNYSAIGPSIADPRTGELLDADVLVEANTLNSYGFLYTMLGTASSSLDQVLDQEPNLSLGCESHDFSAELATQTAILSGLRITAGTAKPGEMPPKAYLNELLKFVVMHEVGHTLGLTHNFRSSTDTPLDKLYDRAWAEKNGLYSSVMDYPTINVRPDGTTGYYYSPVVGSADLRAISYGYCTDPAKAREIARSGALAGHAFANDIDAYGPGAADPRTNVYDLSDDPIAWGRTRAEMLQELMRKLPEAALNDNANYDNATKMLAASLKQYGRLFISPVKTVGGLYTYRDYVGDPEGHQPYEIIPLERQREALQFINDFAFDEKALSLPGEVLQKLGAPGLFHWGMSSSFGPRRDYPFANEVSDFQASLIRQLTEANRLERIRDSELRFGPDKVLGMPELFGYLSSKIFTEIWEKPGLNVGIFRRELQRTYLNRLSSLVTNPEPNAPNDARAVARMQLREIASKLNQRLAPPAHNFDDYTRAHLEELRDLVDAALKAQLSLQKP